MRGRPKQEVTRSANIMIRLFPREKKLICDIAKKYGMKISDVIRCALTVVIEDQDRVLKL